MMEKLGPYFRFKFFMLIPPICYKRPLIHNLYTFMNKSTMLNLKEGKKMKVKLELDQDLDKEMIILKTKKQSSEIKEIVAYIEQKSTPLVGKKQDKNYRIAINDFVNFYSSQKKVFGHTKDQEYIISYRLYELEEQLPHSFVRISNTEIINLNYVQHFQLSKSGLILIRLSNGHMTSSSKRYLKKVKERLL
ncbi:LytTR family transcriptional regulator [Tetragenococcus halophilus]|uniref:LytTR family transcriptional regulator n=2 Tax=Tetragenococcus halophilus TaxID=51669 RepID=A0AB37D4I9_TETHA|nr:LytTR family transcriptional regulator [Tetragenococcus halophilus]